MKKLITVLAVLITTTAFSQTYTVKGSVESDGKPLPSAHITVDSLEIYSNLDGDFELSLPQGEYKIIVDYVSYKSDTINLVVDRNKRILSDLKSRELPKF